jgi:hypothetical protein
MAVRYTKNGKKVGRPNGTGKLRTPENADRICELLEDGKTLRQIAKELGFVSEAEIVRWGTGATRIGRENSEPCDDAFVQRYARAMVARWDRMADETIDIAHEYVKEDVNGHTDTGRVQQLRLQIDTRKWLLSKALPRKYGDKVEATVIGDPNQPLLTRIELVAVPSPRARIEDSQGKTIEHEPDENN